MKIAISFVGTGNYLNYLPDWYTTLKDNFISDVEKVFLVFTDGEGEWPDDVIKIHSEHYGWPETFNHTFENLLKSKEYIQDCDWFVSIDADMKPATVISYNEFFDDTKNYFGVHHPCHYLGMSPHTKFPGSFDVNPKSKACVTEDMDLSVYYQGCLWGGKVPQIFDMLKELDRWTREDLSNNASPIWYEESYFNKFFILNKEKVHTLGPEYAYPEFFTEYCNFEPKMVHLAKDNLKYHI
jgi:hypothetical protein